METDDEISAIHEGRKNYINIQIFNIQLGVIQPYLGRVGIVISIISIAGLVLFHWDSLSDNFSLVADHLPFQFFAATACADDLEMSRWLMHMRTVTAAESYEACHPDGQAIEFARALMNAELR